MAGLDQHVVSTFLVDNPTFVRRWFIANVDVVTMQEWMEEQDDEFDEALAPKSNYSLNVQRNSITSNMFRDFLQGKRKQQVTIRNKNDMLQMSDMDLFMELIRDVANELDVDILCHKILTNVSILTQSDRGSLFLVRGSKNKKYLVSKLFDVTENSKLEDVLHTEEKQIRVPFGKGISGTVAETKDTINIKDAYEDERFNKSVDLLTGYRTKSILCMPILNYEGEVVGVAQIMNKTDETCDVFTPKDEEVFRNYLTFCGIGLTNAQLFEMSVEEYKRNQLLLSLAKGIFAEQQMLDKLVEKIMLEAQELLKCQRCNVFLIEETIEGDNFLYRGWLKDAQDKVYAKIKVLDSEVAKDVLLKQHDAMSGLKKDSEKPEYANPEAVCFTKVFQLKVGKDGAKGTVKNLTIADLENSKTIGIAKQVAATCEVYNVSDSMSDATLNDGIEDYDGLKIKGILSIPILNEARKCVGVVQLINKLNGKPYIDSDVNILEAFAIFCGLGIHNCQMYERACMLMAKQTVALEVLSYHASASHEETEELTSMELPDPDKWQLFEYSFSDFEMTDMETCAGVMQMFQSSGISKKFRIPYDVLARWALSVKKNYRPVTYHNWRHAFNVCQTMYTMCYTSKMNRIFVDLEIFALLVACLSHDLDHRGTNNTFQTKVESPIAQLYSTSTMEHHHFDQCIMILNSEGNNIFINLSSREYRQALKTVESAILSTDLALYFKKKGMFMQMVDAGETKWIDTEKRDTLRGMMMTACDVAAITKPWEVQQEIAKLVSAEFFEQGDLERDILNEDPIAMMDRKKKELLPKMQVGFIDFICLPLYKGLSSVEPKLSPLLEGVENNKREWQNLANEYEAEIKAAEEEAAKKQAEAEETKSASGDQPQGGSSEQTETSTEPITTPLTPPQSPEKKPEPEAPTEQIPTVETETRKETVQPVQQQSQPTSSNMQDSITSETQAKPETSQLTKKKNAVKEKFTNMKTSIQSKACNIL